MKRSTGLEKNRKYWTEIGRRTFRLGYDVEKIAATKVPSFNEWIREGFKKESRRLAK